MSHSITLFFIGLFGSGTFLLLTNYIMSSRRKRAAFRSIINSAQHISAVSNEKSGGLHANVERLPPNVKRYLQIVINNQETTYRTTSLTFNGKFRRNEKVGWQQLHARALYNCITPAFAWFGYFGNAIFHSLTALLSFNQGKGRASLLFFHSIPLLSSSGTETDISLLSRYLAESVYYPFIYLNSDMFEWKDISEHTSSVKFNFNKQFIHALVTFDNDGYISQLTITDRFRDFKGFFEKQTFHAQYSNYTSFQGVLAPTRINYSWENSDDSFPYAELSISSLSYSK